MSALLIKLLSVRGAQEEFGVDLNWEEVIQVAADEYLLSSLHDCIQAMPTPPDVRGEIRNVLSTICELNRERNEKILANVREIAGALNRAGIEPVALKGVAQLLASIYPSLGTRFLNDFDLLVRQSDFSAAIEALRESGYSCLNTDPIESAVGHTYPPLSRPDSVEVDLHRTLGLGICRSMLPASEVLRDSTVHELEGVRIRIPSPEHLVTHQIIHSQIHEGYRERIWPGLRSMYDLVLLQRHFGDAIDWAGIENRFRRNGQYPVLALYLLQVRDLLGLECPLELRLSGLTRMRRQRRKILRAAPWLRMLDPVYVFRASLMPRMPVGEILHLPGGLHYIVKRFFSKRFFGSIFAELS
jgi:Uncharacterised nucleotidyltransferase